MTADYTEDASTIPKTKTTIPRRADYTESSHYYTKTASTIPKITSSIPMTAD